MLSRRRVGVVAALVATSIVSAGVFVVSGNEQQPVPRGLDDQGDLRLIRQTPTRIVLGWTPELTGYGYLFSGDGTVVARTTDPARATATFRNIYTSYEVAAIDKGDTGTYSPLAGTLTMTVTAETANTITFGWTPQAEYGYLFSGDGDVISRTYDPDRSYAKFNKSYTDYEVAVLVKGATGTYPPSPPAGIDVWVSPTGNDGTCARGVQSPACLTLDRATTIAQSGDTIEMAGAATVGGTGGWYDCETLTDVSKVLTIQAASGQYPWIACTDPYVGPDNAGAALNLENVDNLTMDNIYVMGVNFNGGTSNITFNNVHVTCIDDDSHFAQYSDYCNAKIESMDVGDLDTFTMNGGEIGPTVDNDPPTYPGASRMSSDDMTFNGVTFHDNVNLPGGHSECLFLRGGVNVTFRNNSFLRCSVMAVFITCYPLTNGTDAPCLYDNPPDNVVFENNYVGPHAYGHYWSVQVRDTNPPLTMTFRYNTTYRAVDWGPATGEMRGNITAYAGCSGDVTYKYNLFGDSIDRTCGDGTNISVTTAEDAFGSYCDTCGFNTTTGVLNAGSPAIGAGDPADYPATDYEGTVRTSPPDAGWDER